MSDESPGGGAGPGLRWSNWNLLLLVPLIVLITPLTNFREPALFGIPFFYWFSLAFVIVAAICAGIVYVMTKGKSSVTDAPDRLSVDDLDEGQAK